MTQVGASIHDCVDLFDGVLWFGPSGHVVDLGFELFVD